MSPSTSRPQDAFKQPKPAAIAAPWDEYQSRGATLVNVPMFDVLAPPAQARTRRCDFPGPRTIRRVRCACGEHRAGLISGTAEHLVWRTHQVHTAAGASYPCPSSGRCLCQVPAPDVDGVRTPTCDDHGPWTA